MSIESLLRVSRCVAIGKILNVIPSSMPAKTSCFLFVDRVDKRLHTLRVKAVWFREITNIYAYDSIGSNIHYWKVVPLKKGTVSIRVVLQVQVVFAIGLNWLHPFLISSYFFFISLFFPLLFILSVPTITILIVILIVIRDNQFKVWVYLFFFLNSFLLLQFRLINRKCGKWIFLFTHLRF